MNGTRLSIINDESVLPSSGLQGPGAQLGAGQRRLDQVQTRRRRMKQARNMKVLYHYTEGLKPAEDPRDLSMEFEPSPVKYSSVNPGQS